MRQKMWVRKTPGLWWEVGCQCCGHVVYEDWVWGGAMLVAGWHSAVRA